MANFDDFSNMEEFSGSKMIIYGKLISETIIKILKANYGSNYIPISEDLTEELFTAIDTFSG